MMIALIAALTRKRVIGKDDSLPWHIPEEFKSFKRLTAGKTIVMGRKTYESIGRPLPDRKNIVISSSMKQTDGIYVVKSVQEAIEKAALFGDDMWVIGGSTIYGQFLPFADFMYLSYIKKDYSGDVFFPEFNEADWLIESEEPHDEFDLIIYRRNR